ncbi:ABC transporter permease [Olivibacter sp. SDN3]|uniref:ABC transporter permease n=1 Tax=Olivibacter sp. SDN3 TaxID=2764720 RepID=UPI001650FAEF|nr:ABC transporter permease [Olivibacter sp. SDN3]QNL50978.1 ABC transporter permease [Olivibacter sp. SDN3]
MLKNYFKIAWRNIHGHKTYAFINIFGLTLGIACALVIFAVVRYHFSFDNFHLSKDRIYRVVTELKDESTSRYALVPRPLGKAIREDFSFVGHSARLVTAPQATVSFPELSEDEKFIEETGIAFTEPGFFSIFHFPFLQGDQKAVLQQPNEVLITESIAKKYFGSTNPMGKTLRVGAAANQADYTIKGILKDFPANTDIKQEIFLSYHALANGPLESVWKGLPAGSVCYLALKEGVNELTAQEQLRSLSSKYYEGKDVDVWNFHLQPLADVHFNPDYDGVVNKSYLYTLLAIAFLLLATASVNFINLATAQAITRSKEIGVRKVLGSKPKQLFWQFISETAIIVGIATLLAITLAFLVLPAINQLLQANIPLQLLHWHSLLFLALLFLLTTLLSGFYPGLVLAGFRPIKALQGKITQKDIGGFPLRRLLVVGQFAISQILIIGTLVIANQIRYAQQTDLGFNKEAIVSLPLPESANLNKKKVLRERLASIPGVESASLNFQAPASAANGIGSLKYHNNPEEEKWNINMKFADDQYLATFGIKLLAGRNLFPADSVNEFLVNETFLKKLNISSPDEALGKKLAVNGQNSRGTIVGVVKDFYNYSLHTAKDPICIMSLTDLYGNCSVKLSGQSFTKQMAAIAEIWKETYPDFVYSYQFFDDSIAAFYETENVMLKLVQGFGLIAILIGCFGLYGLISFMALQKTKEIGVRKVLGANLLRILWIFGKEFSLLLLLAFLLAAPLAWWAMNMFLQDYAYRVPIGADIFLSAILITLLIAILTVGYRSISAALANPVDSLRNE